MPHLHPGPARDARLLGGAVALVWLATAFAVLHPSYQAIGGAYLTRLGLPSWLMFATCAGEGLLGLYLLARPIPAPLALLQVGAVAFFTLALASIEPALLYHPFGVLTKNLPFCAAVLVAWRLPLEGYSARVTWGLRAGMAIVWITEGLLPKLLFVSQGEVELVAASGLVPIDPALFLRGLGLLQIGSGVAALLLRGRALRFVLAAQVFALVVLPLLVSWQFPLLWLHPFGPLTKNAPVLVGTALVLLRCSRST